uniref:Uncharacterized protein n=1 Tax=Mycena chlorophos TaxID=658473 RepID=A0ABQ0LFW3_MYCCL|nr:predicted protein [Mycena chlorophos]
MSKNDADEARGTYERVRGTSERHAGRNGRANGGGRVRTGRMTVDDTTGHGPASLSPCRWQRILGRQVDDGGAHRRARRPDRVVQQRRNVFSSQQTTELFVNASTAREEHAVAVVRQRVLGPAFATVATAVLPTVGAWAAASLALLPESKTIHNGARSSIDHLPSPLRLGASVAYTLYRSLGARLEASLQDFEASIDDHAKRTFLSPTHISNIPFTVSALRKTGSPFPRQPFEDEPPALSPYASASGSATATRMVGYPEKKCLGKPILDLQDTHRQVSRSSGRRPNLPLHRISNICFVVSALLAASSSPQNRPCTSASVSNPASLLGYPDRQPHGREVRTRIERLAVGHRIVRGQAAPEAHSGSAGEYPPSLAFDMVGPVYLEAWFVAKPSETRMDHILSSALAAAVQFALLTYWTANGSNP